MQVSRWLGHSTYTLTLDVYGDYIPEEDGGALNMLLALTSLAWLGRGIRARTVHAGVREARTLSTMQQRVISPAAMQTCVA